MRMIRWSIALSCLLIAPVLWAQAPTPAASRAEVQRVVERYLHGLKFNDTLSLRAAFWPNAKLMWVKRDGTLGELTQPDWYRSFSPSAGKEEAGDLRIESIDVTGDVASVKVVETYPASIYVDYLNLVRFGGEWRIVNKVYTSRRR